MKKIVILYRLHWEQVMGGAELQISYLVHELAKRFEVHFIYEERKKKITNIDKIHLHPLKKIRLKQTLGHYRFLYKLQILKKLNLIKPDVIYTRGFSSWSGIAAEYAKKNGIKHIWAIARDDNLPWLQRNTSVLRPLNLFENWYVKKAVQGASFIITQNDFQEKQLLKLYK